jgi:hypothetical protein
MRSSAGGTAAMRRHLPLITHDPASGAELIVTRLECPQSGVVIEGRFDLGWIAKLTPEQLDFVGLLLRYRTNLNKLSDELGVAYNTVRSRLDDVVEALGGPPDAEAAPAPNRSEILSKIASGELSVDDAIAALRGS